MEKARALTDEIINLLAQAKIVGKDNQHIVGIKTNKTTSQKETIITNLEEEIKQKILKENKTPEDYKDYYDHYKQYIIKKMEQQNILEPLEEIIIIILQKIKDKRKIIINLKKQTNSEFNTFIIDSEELTRKLHENALYIIGEMEQSPINNSLPNKKCDYEQPPNTFIITKEHLNEPPRDLKIPSFMDSSKNNTNDKDDDNNFFKKFHR
ncbi:MAG: hypothetical protein RR703_03910 [Bacilli bacterium]